MFEEYQVQINEEIKNATGNIEEIKAKLADYKTSQGNRYLLITNLLLLNLAELKSNNDEKEFSEILWHMYIIETTDY